MPAVTPQRGPLVGHNDNVSYRGQTYHVQTEDSGLRRTNVATHLFADGGRIVHSVKTSYAELASAPDGVERVKTLMREQHRGMVNALASGELDGILASPAPRRETPPMVRAAVAVPPSQAAVAAQIPAPIPAARAPLETMPRELPPAPVAPPSAVAPAPTSPEGRGFGARYRGGPPLHALALAALERLGWRRS